MIGAFQRAVGSAADFNEAVNAAAAVMRKDLRRLGFVVCGECEGGGCYHCKSAASKHDHSKYPCPTCRGSGLVATDELREKATDTLLHVLYLGSDRSQLGSTQVRMHERAADAVLRLVAEHLGAA